MNLQKSTQHAAVNWQSLQFLDWILFTDGMNGLAEWTYDEKTGYHFNAATGYYYDPNSGFYYSEILGMF